MKEYRFILQPYKGRESRTICPHCHHKNTFVRYIDREGTITFPAHVGRCNREIKCGYIFTPKEYFKLYPHQMPESFSVDRIDPEPTKQISFIDKSIVQSSMCHYEKNNLFLYLSSLLGKEDTEKLMKKYGVGTAKFWDGATVFWQTDTNGNVRTGKIMLYGPENGKRVKGSNAYITWVHALLPKCDFHLKQCFFGEHLLENRREFPVALVESEKTALVASYYLPDFTWIASGGKNGCLHTAKDILKGFNVILFPDLGATDLWRKESLKLEEAGIHNTVFDYLERNATEDQRKNGYDIADFLVQMKPDEAILKMMIAKYPVLGEMVKMFDLVLDKNKEQDLRYNQKPTKKSSFKLR